MPLSEHEQRLLDQIERALYQEDPKFASTVRQTDLRTHMRRRLRRAALVLALGFGLLLAGVVSQQYPLGIAGFVVMVGALLIAMNSYKRMGQGPGGRLQAVPDDPSGAMPGARPQQTAPQRPQRPGRPAKQKRPSGGGSFKDRLEERWNRRWDERGRER